MTVRETLDFSARCQGIGSRAGRPFFVHVPKIINFCMQIIIPLKFLVIEDMMKEVSRREKQAGIVPEPDIDTYMKVKNQENKCIVSN